MNIDKKMFYLPIGLSVMEGTQEMNSWSDYKGRGDLRQACFLHEIQS